MVEVSQNEDFLQKTASKTGFLRDMKQDQLTLEGAGTPNFKSTDIFDMVPENLALWRKPLRKVELRILSKMITFAPIFSSQNYFR